MKKSMSVELVSLLTNTEKRIKVFPLEMPFKVECIAGNLLALQICAPFSWSTSDNHRLPSPLQNTSALTGTIC
jgi:hypothetical protein